MTPTEFHDALRLLMFFILACGAAAVAGAVAAAVHWWFTERAQERYVDREWRKAIERAQADQDERRANKHPAQALH